VMPSSRDDEGAPMELEGFLDSLFVGGQQNHIGCSRSILIMSRIGSFQLPGIASLHH
jgi:hypothetical protein